MDAPVAIRSALLEHVDPADVRTLVAHARPRTFHRGQVVFQRGDEADGLYVVVSGEFRIVLEGARGKEYTLSVIGPGDVLGDLPLLDGMGRTASAIASNRVQSLFVSAADFDTWLTRNPHALRAIAVGLARRLRANMERVAEMGLFDVGARVQRYLWRLFTEASEGREPQAGLELPLNQSEAASSVGTTRESVNKELRRLRERRIIAMENRSIRLLDPAALRELLHTL
jgi:CRP-like cAMP-binding protein